MGILCSQCAHDNPAESNFCLGCGARIGGVTCRGCGRILPSASRFCNQCGAAVAAPSAAHPRFDSPGAYTPTHLAEKILTSKSALEGERKQVTVLFVDVSGFTSLSERLDPEEVHRLMQHAFDLMLAEVHRYEGTVNQFLGDGIMALFGAPVAHEDHARRGVGAALGIARALGAWQAELAPRGVSFRVRQGLNTGLVVVGAIGRDLRMDYTAVGDTTNVAARLQQLAEPGRVTVSDAVYRLVRGYFEMRPIGEVHLKGRDEPVTAWEAVATHERRTRLEVETDRGLTPLVGRERELEALLEAFDAAREGKGQVALVIGEAGIGKSRLLHEFRARIGHLAAWQEGHCLSFGRAIAFHPLVDLVRRRFGIDDGDSEAAIGAKIERGIGELPDGRSVAPYLRLLLSIDPGDADVRAMTPAQRRAETFDAIRRLVFRDADRRPLVLVIEDLHWIDSASEEFLVSLADSVPVQRALLIVTYRPGYANPFGDRSYVTRIVPRALSPEDSARMTAAAFGFGTLPDALGGFVSAKADGNPFYIEEVVKSLNESSALGRVDGRLTLARPLQDLAIPATIHDVVAARIDRLGDAPKRALQLASVIGREFTRRLFDRLAEIPQRTDELLRELSVLELIQERRRYPELVYAFRHALTQDVAYASMLRQRRRELHRLVGLAIQDLYGDRLPEQYEILAHHFSRAEEWEHALGYLVRAAEKAAHAFAVREALTLYDEATAIAHRLGSGAAGILGAVHGARADLLLGVGDWTASRAAAEARLALARSVGDTVAAAAALVQIATANMWAEDFPGALARSQEAIEVAEAIDARATLAGGLYIRGFVGLVSGDVDQAGTDLRRALASVEATQDFGRHGFILQGLALRHGWRGEYRLAAELCREALALVRPRRILQPLLFSLFTEGVAWCDLGEYDAAFEVLTEAMALAERSGSDPLLTRATNTLGWVHIECGDVQRGIQLSEQSYDLTIHGSRAQHATGAERRAFIRTNQSDALLALGDVSQAAELLDEVRHIVEHPPPSRWMTWRYTVHYYATLGQLALARGDADQARRCADQSLELAAPTRSRKYEAWAWRIRGESATRRRAWDEADDALRRALAIAESIRHPRQTWLTQVALGGLRAAQGRGDDARRRYRAAGEAVARARERTREPGLRSGLARTPWLRALEDLSDE